jgi:signal transduction histidine kinase
LLASACQAYSHAFPERRFSLRAPETAVHLHGAPDLILQMMDKLIDNAVDFSPADSLITISLEASPELVILDVDNLGPALPEGAEQLIFESLWQSRSGLDGKPHFGLGLYIARLIAEFHGGVIRAQNLPGTDGVRFRITLRRGP